MKFRNDIQGLRALAVIAVIIFHLDSSFLPGGFLGVDIFFVISGFLISKSIISQIDQNSFDFFRFFQGRFKRIVPAYYFMLIACIGLAIFYFPTTDFSKFFSQAKDTLLFLSNQSFASTLNYFGGQNHENLLLHTWSLSIEMQFYFFLPLILMLIPKRWRIPFFIFSFFLLLGYTEYNLRILNNRSEMYFSLPARSLEFMVGIFINFIPKPKKFPVLFKNFLGGFALLVIIASLFFINETSIFPGLISLPACFGIAAIIWSQEGKVNDFFNNRILVYIGKISYSLYLWHWPVLAFYRYRNDAYEIELPQMLLLSVLFISLSLISYYIIEEPFRKLRSKALFQRGILVVAAVALFWRGSHYANRKAVPIPLEYVKYIQSANHNKYTGYQLIGDVAKEDSKILLIGDSHALSMLPFFEELGKNNRLNFSFLSSDSFLPFPGFENYPFQSQRDLKRYKSLSPIGDVLIKQSDIIIVIRQWYRTYDFENQIEYLTKTIRPDQDLVFMTDYPSLEKNPVRKYLSLTKPKDFKPEALKQPVLDSLLLTSLKSKSNFHLLDVEDKEFFKHAPFFNDTLMYYDERHINKYGSKKFVAYKVEKVADFLLDLKQNLHTPEP